MKPTSQLISDIAKKIRYEITKMSHLGEAAHLGSSLSCVDLIVALYHVFLKIEPSKPFDRLRDRFILSKGHAISSLYAVLVSRDFFSEDLLATFNQDGSSLPEHPSPNCMPGVEVATGSLGHELSIGIGHALASKILTEPDKVVVLLSDGECNEGTVWEAALFAPAKNLNNLIAIIDFNKWQATGRSEETMTLSPLKNKWESFGWQTYEIDGHNIDEILDTFNKISKKQEKPIAIIAHTIKGKGISFMEDDNNWHYRIPTQEELLKVKNELGII
ncbi:MAG: transketolase [Chlamydiae bacterium]|nr:transketolase [Chlamydiota bacterium]